MQVMVSVGSADLVCLVLRFYEEKEKHWEGCTSCVCRSLVMECIIFGTLLVGLATLMTIESTQHPKLS